ncbi:MAG: hypothetical protein ABSH16_04760 [Sedimentisphaerales bacterium]
MRTFLMAIMIIAAVATGNYRLNAHYAGNATRNNTAPCGTRWYNAPLNSINSLVRQYPTGKLGICLFFGGIGCCYCMGSINLTKSVT